MFGQRRTFLEHGFFTTLPFVAAFMGFFVTSPFIYTYAIVAGVGFALIVTAKIPSLKRGDFLSFGSQSMDPKSRKLYWIGYAIVAIAIAGGLYVILKA